MKAKRRPTKKQLAARKLFAKRAKAGEFKRNASPRKSARRKAARIDGVPIVNPKERFGRSEMMKQGEIIAEHFGPIQLYQDGATYQFRSGDGSRVISPRLSATRMKDWLHGAIAAVAAK